MNGKRIAVTGLGLLTPVGNDVMSSWSAIRAGKSGIKPIETFDVSEFSTRFGGALQAFDRDKYLPAKEARRMDEFMHYGIAAGIQALED
ncbi:MAG: beta-ketoacyl synthase N-terminal-like domain-containing protein, partial [Gammaproteobacteria bacterium]|nr:beta-ketoacyl synthase N-terminal-like domain-containing protein [Gammaproteobacteria bacterium]